VRVRTAEGELSMRYFCTLYTVKQTPAEHISFLQNKLNTQLIRKCKVGNYKRYKLNKNQFLCQLKYDSLNVNQVSISHGEIKDFIFVLQLALGVHDVPTW
jgi:hypothetical protein